MKNTELLRSAKILFASGQLEKSIAVFTQAEDMGCDGEDVWLSRGAARMALGNFGEASHDFSRVIENNTSHERARYFRGIARAALGHYEEAIEDLTVSLSQNNSRGIAHLIRGLAFTEIGQEEDAALDINSSSVFSEAEISSFKKIFGEKEHLFTEARSLLAEESAPWNNLLSRESARKLRNLLL